MPDVTPELPATYYLDNFCHLLSQVRDLYDDLLSDDERSFCRDFFQLSTAAQCLYVRLLGRRGDWFRSDRLEYREIDDIPAALRELASQRFIQLVLPTSELARTTCHEWVSLFTRPELVAVLGRGNLSGCPKEQLVTLVCDEVAEGNLLLTTLTDDPIVCVYGEQELDTLRLLFFGNLHQNLTDFVLRDLGIYRYVEYEISTSTRWCQTRAQLERHAQLFALWPDELWFRQASVNDLVSLAASLPEAGDDRILRRRSDRLLNQTGRQLERLSASTEALAIYAKSTHHPARERTLRLLVQVGQTDQAETYASEMAAAPWCEEELQFLMSFVPRKLKDAVTLCESLNQSRHQPQSDLLVLPADISRTELGVERATAEALAREYPGDNLFYCENLLIPGMFGLIFWDAVFAPLEGAFFHPFQIRPADLYDEDFSDKRQSLMTRCWQSLADSDTLLNAALGAFERYHGLANPFVHWGFLSKELLTLAVRSIPVEHWQKCFEFMLRDLRHHRAGLPDLIRFCEDGSYELIEVKGPGDTLQKNQKAWLQAFDRAGIPARVLLVRDAPDPDDHAA